MGTELPLIRQGICVTIGRWRRVIGTCAQAHPLAATWLFCLRLPVRNFGSYSFERRHPCFPRDRRSAALRHKATSSKTRSIGLVGRLRLCETLSAMQALTKLKLRFGTRRTSGPAMTESGLIQRCLPKARGLHIEACPECANAQSWRALNWIFAVSWVPARRFR
jgi:hypothetical protein